MRYRHVLFALLVAGCTSGEMPTLESNTPPAVPTASCEGKSAKQCKFINSPVKLSSKPLRLPDSPYPFFKTRNTLEFVNAEGKVWIAPAGILTDGASIPMMFVAFIGNPRSKEFLNAATVHDSYCAESNKDTPYYHTARWQDVHRMFYDALRVSGTPAIKAKIMYAAVYLGGPRWKEVRKPGRSQKAELNLATARMRFADAAASGNRITLESGVTITAAASSSLRDMQSDTPLPQLYPEAQLIEAFKKAQEHIKAINPPIHVVETYLTQLELNLSGGNAAPGKMRHNFKPRQRTPEDYLDDMRGEADGTGAGDAGDNGGNDPSSP